MEYVDYIKYVPIDFVGLFLFIAFAYHIFDLERNSLTEILFTFGWLTTGMKVGQLLFG